MHIASLPASFSGSINLAKPYRPETWDETSPPPTIYFPGENWEDHYDQIPDDRPPRLLEEERPPLLEPLYDDDYGWEGAIDDQYNEQQGGNYPYPNDEVGCYFYDNMQTIWYHYTMEAPEKVCRK